jgi:acyl-coenzyme A thioesterase PaaI-like protein
MGLAVRYELEPDGAVRGTFLGHCALEGYPGLLHGGVIAALMDGAMTNCLFAHGITAVTAELQMRYRVSVASSEPLEVRAWLVSSRHGLHQLRAELTQTGLIKVQADSKFMPHE